MARGLFGRKLPVCFHPCRPQGCTCTQSPQSCCHWHISFRGPNCNNLKKRHLAAEHVRRQVQASQRELHQGVQLVARQPPGGKALQVHHQHLRQRPQVQLFGCLGRKKDKSYTRVTGACTTITWRSSQMLLCRQFLLQVSGLTLHTLRVIPTCWCVLHLGQYQLFASSSCSGCRCACAGSTS